MAESIIDQLGAAPVMLSLLYLAVLILAASKLKMLHRLSPSLDTKKLFCMSILLSCLTRTMSFITIGALNLQSIRIGGMHRVGAGGAGGGGGGGGREDPDRRFYEKTLMVLLDLPDFIIISAYTLLAVVWAEGFLQSRRHWLSSKRYRRSLLLGYLVFNAVLYAAQVVLYGLLFLPYFSRAVVVAVIYLGLGFLNFLLPVAMVLLFLWLTCTFSGFPFKSPRAMLRLRKVGRVVFVWTLARLAWAVAALTAVLGHQSLAATGGGVQQQVYSVLIVALFLLTELGPFLLSLDDDLLTHLARDEPPLGAAGGGGPPLLSHRSVYGNGGEALLTPAAASGRGGGGGSNGGGIYSGERYSGWYSPLPPGGIYTGAGPGPGPGVVEPPPAWLPPRHGDARS